MGVAVGDPTSAANLSHHKPTAALASAAAFLPTPTWHQVPDLDLARVFYAEGLGLTADPDTLGWQRGGPFVTWWEHQAAAPLCMCCCAVLCCAAVRLLRIPAKICSA